MSQSSESAAYVRVAEDMRGSWVGPLPLCEFLGLLPGKDSGHPLPTPPLNIFKKIPPNLSRKVKDMYAPLIAALESLKLKHLQFKNTSGHSDPTSPSYEKWRPDISVYCSDTKFKSGGLKNTASSARFSELVLPFKVKRGKSDPFSDKPTKLDSPFEGAPTEVQGRIAAILNGMLSMTWRTHAFSVFMDGQIARLFRADRAGVLVSEAFDYRKNPKHLTDFLRRLNNTTPDHWGFDCTFDRGHKVIRVPTFSHSQPEYIEIKLEDEEELSHTESLVSSGRRVVRARGQISNELYIMKDGWRRAIPDETPEWSILSELNRNQVLHIPRILFGGDIPRQPYQYTRTDCFADYDWRAGPKTRLTPRIHYRYIENNAGEPLKNFRNAKELTRVLRDVLQALRDAWVKCNYLHCDVSSGNILITPSGEGILIDWEYAKKYPEGEEPQGRASGRTGTWTYMSAALQMKKYKPHSFLDDLQSVYWVGLKNALNSLEHTYQEGLPGVARCLTTYYPATDDGGYYKAAALLDPSPIEFVGNPAFTSLMKDFGEMMGNAHRWQMALVRGQVMAGAPPPSNVPDYDKVLKRFNKALNRLNHEWSPKLSDNINQLGPFMEDTAATQCSKSTNRLSGSQRTFQSSRLKTLSLSPPPPKVIRKMKKKRKLDSTTTSTTVTQPRKRARTGRTPGI